MAQIEGVNLSELNQTENVSNTNQVGNLSGLFYLRLLGQKILTPSNTVASVKSSLINHDASHFSVYYFNSTFVGCFASGVSLQRQIGKVMGVFLGKQADKCGNSSFVRKSKEDSCFAKRKQYPLLNNKATENEVKLA